MKEYRGIPIPDIKSADKVRQKRYLDNRSEETRIARRKYMRDYMRQFSRITDNSMRQSKAKNERLGKAYVSRGRLGSGNRASDNEEMRPIPGNAPYIVSEYGFVFNTKTGRWLTQTKNKRNGYKYVCLSVSSEERRQTGRTNKIIPVHICVALAWHGGRPLPGTDKRNRAFTVNHKDMNKDNNHYSNLEWITQLDNYKHFQSNELAKAKVFVDNILSNPRRELYTISQLLKVRRWAPRLGIEYTKIKWIPKVHWTEQALNEAVEVCKHFLVMSKELFDNKQIKYKKLFIHEQRLACDAIGKKYGIRKTRFAEFRHEANRIAKGELGGY